MTTTTTNPLSQGNVFTTTETPPKEDFSFSEYTFCLPLPSFVFTCLNTVVILAIIGLLVYVLIELQCKKKPLRALDEQLMAVKELKNPIDFAEWPVPAIVLLCELHGIRPSIVHREYELDQLQRRASSYSTFGVSDAFSVHQKGKEMQFYKKFIERFINWDQNYYMRKGRSGERKIIEAYGMQQPKEEVRVEVEKNPTPAAQ